MGRGFSRVKWCSRSARNRLRTPSETPDSRAERAEFSLSPPRLAQPLPRPAGLSLGQNWLLELQPPHLHSRCQEGRKWRGEGPLLFEEMHQNPQILAPSPQESTAAAVPGWGDGWKCGL